MPASLSKTRLRKAFTEGRRSAVEPAAENPYDNPKLRRLWELGRSQQQAGEIPTPIPRLVHGETRAFRSAQNPPGTKPAARPPARPRTGPGRPPVRRGPFGR